MSTHYLIDMFTNPISSSPIVDVIESSNGQSVINGSYVVRIPEIIPIAQPLPSTLGNLIIKKYAGLLAFYTGFTNIVYDDMQDATGIDQTVNHKATFGERGSISLAAGSSLQSVITPLVSTPTAAVLTWEVFSYINSDPKADLFTRTYSEVAAVPVNTTAQVSFNGGATFAPALDGAVLSIPLVNQGDDLIVRITNATAGRLYLGSWALIY